MERSGEKALRVFAVVAVTLMLAGCSAPSKLPGPKPIVAVAATPPARSADTSFDKWDAYLACRNLSLPFVDPDNAQAAKFATFAHSYLVKRKDGLFYVYIEYVDTSYTGASHLGAAVCILGGTLGSPIYVSYGASDRIPIDKRHPNQALAQD